MTTGSRPTPLRSIAEIAVMAAFLIFVPPLAETALTSLGFPTTGITRIVATGVMFAGIVLVVWLLLRLRGETLRDIGLKRPGNIYLTAVLGLVLAAAMFVTLEILKRAGIMTEDRLGDMASELKDNLALTLARMGLSLFIVGFVEELLFRGFVLDRLAKTFAAGQSRSRLRSLARQSCLASRTATKAFKGFSSPVASVCSSVSSSC
jgi:membrane protease YdiL (CAAX protease family)